MGLAINARMVRSVAKDAILTYQDVKLDEHQLSFKLRQAMENKMR
jgi:predicted homoserine dehydrogenase-like protein